MFATIPNTATSNLSRLRLDQTFKLFVLLLCFSFTARAQTSLDSASLHTAPDVAYLQPNQILTLDVLANDGCNGFPDLNGDGQPDCPVLKIAAAEIVGFDGLSDDYISKSFQVTNLGDALRIRTGPESAEGEVYVRYVASGGGQTVAGLLTIGVTPWPGGPITKKCWSPQLQCPIVPNCGLICNSSIGQNYLSTPNNVQNGGTPHWNAAQGTPNTSPGDPFSVDCGVMGMWRHNDATGEAAYTVLNQTATPANVYLLTYIRRVPTSYTVQLDQLVTRLGSATDFSTFSAASTTGLIFNDPNIAVGPTATVGMGFIPTSTFTHFGIYPRQTTHVNQTTGVIVDDIELMAYPPLQSFIKNVGCCKAVQLTAPSCHNANTVWEWYQMPTNTLVHSGDTPFNTPPVCTKTTYELRLKVNTNIVGGTPIGYSYTLVPDCPQECCPCDSTFYNAVSQGFSYFQNGTTISFVPNGSLSGSCDKVLWTLFPGNTVIGTTFGNQVFTYTLPSGQGFGVCMTVIRNSGNGQVCEQKFCRDLVLHPVKDGCCKCDSTFIQAVQAGISNAQVASNTHVFTPNGQMLSSCDRVTWNFGDASPTVTTVGNASATHNYSTSGSYTVCIKVTRVADDGTVCSDGACITIQTVGTDDPQVDYKITTQPNPFNSSTLIRFGQMPPSGFTVELLDAQGRAVRSYTDLSVAALRIERDGLPAGAYFYRVISSEGISVGKLVVAD